MANYKKTENTPEKIGKNTSDSIPFYTYSIDSGRFEIDSYLFKSLSFPTNFTIIDSDTGVEIDTYSKNLVPVPFNGNKFQVGIIRKEIPNTFKIYEKVAIYISSKVCGKNYFNGLQLQDLKSAIIYLSELGYLEFDDINNVLNNVYIKDLDIKYDMNFAKDKINFVKDWVKWLRKELFNNDIHFCNLYNNQKVGFGLTTYTRQTGTTVHPFTKFYDKSIEIKTDKNYQLYSVLSDNIKEELEKYFILRFEFTFKNKEHFDKHFLSNKLVDLLNTNQESWQVVANRMMQLNFEPVIRKTPEFDEISPIEKILILNFNELWKKGVGTNLNGIKGMYVRTDQTRIERCRMNKLFEKIASYSMYNDEDDIRIKTLRNAYLAFTEYNELFKLNKYF